MGGDQAHGGRSPIRAGIAAASVLVLGVVLALGLALAGGFGVGPGGSAADAPVTRDPPPPSCGYCGGNLVGKTAREIGQYAVQWSLYNAYSYVLTGTPQVLLARGVTREDLPRLGLGCLGGALTAEEPPYALVILKGEFASRRFGRSSAEHIPPTSYLELVIDLWAGSPTLWNGSATGAEFRTALDDPSLPVSTDRTPFGPCPPTKLIRFPDGSPLHYGDAAPGCSGPCPTQPGVLAPPTRTPGPLPPPNPTFAGR